MVTFLPHGNLNNTLFFSRQFPIWSEIWTKNNIPATSNSVNTPVFNFVSWQVIELELRADVGLPHAVVTHLAQVEDKVLESMAWTSDSPLWEEIRDNEGHLPTCQQVGNKTHKNNLTKLAQINIQFSSKATLTKE